ncbi:MAG: hypothetical protein M1832_004718 [Thelocarpon impressellum]|nr:MAG: hypothetical protein M1832_004718 [Thelocarpon impressellum]
MRSLDFLYPALLALSALTVPASGAKKPAKNAVLLSDVSTLTLRKDVKTSHRRVSAIPQLRCVGGNAKGLYDVDVLRCKNQGADYDEQNVQWTCTSSLPPEFKLGSTDVICEGYASPEDPYILKGSCGVEYRLALTPLGEEKFGGRSFLDPWESFNRRRGGRLDISTLIFWGIFVAVAGWIVYKAFFAARRRPGGARLGNGGGGNPWGGGGGGGGWGGGGGGGGGWGTGLFDTDNDPPPPYDAHQAPRKPTAPPRAAPNAQGQGQAWRPGFWTGVLGGTAAGYLAGNRGGQTRQQQQYQRRNQGGFWGTGNGEGSSGWDSGGRGGSYGGGSSSGSGGGGFASSSRHESSGFGGTSRR